MRTPSRKPAPTDVPFVGVEATGRDDFVSLRQKRRDYLVKARAIGPNSVTEHDARFGLHGHLLLRTQDKANCICGLARFGLFCRFLSPQQKSATSTRLLQRQRL